MGRRKIYKRYRQKYSLHVTMTGTASDRINLIAEDVKTPNISDNATCIKNRTMNNSHDRTPEFVMQESKKTQYYDEISPKINVRLPKLKLNLDIPENDDTEDMEDNKNNTVKEQGIQAIPSDLEKTLSVEKVFGSFDEENTVPTIKNNDFTKCFSMTTKTNSEHVDVSRKQMTSLSDYFQIPSSTFKISSAFVKPSPSNFAFVSGQMQSNAKNENTINNACLKHFKNDNLLKLNKNKFSSAKNDSSKNSSAEMCCVTLEHDKKLNNSDGIKNISNLVNKTCLGISAENPASVDLPVLSDMDSKTTEVSKNTFKLNA